MQTSVKPYAREDIWVVVLLFFPRRLSAYVLMVETVLKVLKVRIENLGNESNKFEISTKARKQEQNNTL